MSKPWLVLALVALVCAGCRAAPLELPGDAAAEAVLAEALDGLLELELSRDPVWATHLGERRFDDRLDDLSEDGAERYRVAFEALAARIAALEPARLSAQGRDSQAVVAAELLRVRAARTCRLERWRVDATSGPQVRFPVLARTFPVRSLEDLDALERRFGATGAAVEGRIAALRAGVASGHVPTRANVERVLAQLDAALAVALEDEPMLELFDATGAALDDPGTRARLAQVVETVVRPALVSYREVLRAEILPVAREQPGVLALPDGAACYAALVEAHLGPGHDPDALHALGLRLVAEAEARVAALGAEAVGVEGGDVAAVRAAVLAQAREREDGAALLEGGAPEREDGAALLEDARAALARADAALGRVVSRLPPEGRLRIEAMAPSLARHGPLALYQGAGAGGTSRVFVNTERGAVRGRHLVEALIFHEALPGHHLQDALAAQAEGVHPWRRRLEQAAFTEGWGLYAESLAAELGLYSGPLAELGRAELEAWRAARLVVDTGLHHHGWSREEGIAYLVAHTWLAPEDAAAEVDRYAAWPGQALAYVVGMRALVALREEAAASLGEAFELRAFHDEVLRRGPVPLSLLEARVRAWLEAG